MILYLNACVRGESRTKRLAEHLLSRLGEPVRERKLWELDFPCADEDFLKQRDALLAKGERSAPLFDLAREFAEADTIVVAAPYWDLSFPAAVKQYFEQVSVVGITFAYTDEGVPVGLCRAKRLYYVTTAGGTIFSGEFGYGYIRTLTQGMYGIPETFCFQAEGLDVAGADVDAILSEVEGKMDAHLKG